MKCNVSPHSQENFLHEARVFEQFEKNVSAFNFCEQVINFGVLTELLVQQSNLYSQQYRRYFLTYVKEMKALIAVNYIMAINQLSSIPMYWDCDRFEDNIGIQNIFTRTAYQESLQNLHFTDNKNNTKQIKAIRLDQSSITWMNYFRQ